MFVWQVHFNRCDMKVYYTEIGNQMLKYIEYRKLFLIVGLIWIIGFLIATLATPDVISSSNVLSSFCKLVECKSWMKYSDFPEVATFYFWVVWASLPFWICIWWKYFCEQVSIENKGFLFRKKLLIRHRLAVLLTTPLWFFLFYVSIFWFAGEDSRLFKIGTSRIGLGLWGMAVPMASAITICLGVFGLKRFLTFKE